MTRHPLLTIDRLTVRFSTPQGSIAPVDQLSLSIAPGETLALVGESGCGKSVTAMAILRLLPIATTRYDGRILLADAEQPNTQADILQLPEASLRTIRGQRIAMIFQEPMTSLHPTRTIGWQMEEVLLLHTSHTRTARKREVIHLLDRVGIESPAQCVTKYAHQLSGGMRQRVMIAMAMATRPALLIADEPTTALDVTIQRQVLDLLQEWQNTANMSMLLITHDLGVASYLAHRTCVMYAGRMVEQAPTPAILQAPHHPYTKALLACVPRIQRGEPTSAERGLLPSIDGYVPDPAHRPTGCAFHPRCPLGHSLAAQHPAQAVALGDEAATSTLRRCVEGDGNHPIPLLRTVSDGHDVACWEV